MRDAPELAAVQAALELFDDRPHGTRLSVNVSPALLGDSRLLRALDEHRIAADLIAGYAGLGQLAALRLGTVKLDRGLIEGVDTSPHRAALVAALVGYADRTGIALVAEGIERPHQLAAVRRLGVTLAQG